VNVRTVRLTPRKLLSNGKRGEASLLAACELVLSEGVSECDKSRRHGFWHRTEYCVTHSRRERADSGRVACQGLGQKLRHLQRIVLAVSEQSDSHCADVVSGNADTPDPDAVPHQTTLRLFASERFV
jgi:hypothetical protein